ncbi:MAG TPA: DUF1990 domain-containing protein [Rugosimonospora sp.]|nr:DUF1990 domain-containing protein [Rugosimonospora sp.]
MGELTYPEVGATRYREMPGGYRRIRGRARVGTGEMVFAAAVRTLATFDMQRGAGLRVRTAAPQAAVGVEVASGLGAGPLRMWAPCRVVWVVEEPMRYGYAYGTLPGHPEIGEEGFLVWLEPDGVVRFEVRAFSRPSSRLVALAGPLPGLLQDLVTDRYLASLLRQAHH